MNRHMQKIFTGDLNGEADYSLIITIRELNGEVNSLTKSQDSGRQAVLSMTECNSAFGEIVRGEFQSDFVTRQNADAIAAEPARQVGQHHPLVFQLNAEQAAGKFL